MMQSLARAIACAVAISALSSSGCTTPTFSAPEFDGGSASGLSCNDDYFLCGTRCCLEGMECVAGECRFPYSTARMWVYLCPSFNTPPCDSQFFSLDQTCSPITDSARPGTCYDTGFEVNANSSYGIAACHECGSSCGNPAGFETPPGFFGTDWYSGFAFSCDQRCMAPPDCGGRSTGPDPEQGGTSGGGPGGGGSGGFVGGVIPGTDGGQDDPGAGSGGIGGPGAGSGGTGGGTGLCAVSSAGSCVECTGVGDPACGSETCCSLDGAAFCTDLTVHACIQCTSNEDCDPGIPCCKPNQP